MRIDCKPSSPISCRPALLIVCLAAAIYLCGFSACSSGEAEVKKAEQAVQQFHDRYNAGEYRMIFKEAHQLYRDTDTEEGFSGTFTKLHSVMGNNTISKVASYRYIAATSGRPQVYLQYATTFANGEATEEFNWEVGADGARLLMYNINSPLLP